MLSTAVSSLSLNAPVVRPAVSNARMAAITPGDVGTTKPLGVYDPLGLMTRMPDKYRRWQEMEIKHGRFAMAATLHVILTEAGIRWPGYLSFAEDIKFSDMPGGTLASWAALPNLAWIQIVLIVALLDNSVLAQDPAKAPGDVIPFFWVRYPDVEGFSGKEFKLNAGAGARPPPAPPPCPATGHVPSPHPPGPSPSLPSLPSPSLPSPSLPSPPPRRTQSATTAAPP